MDGDRCGSAALYARMRDHGNWRITTRSKLIQCWQFRSIGLHWSNQLDLDFILDHLQPLLGSRGAALKTFDFGFQLADPILDGHAAAPPSAASNSRRPMVTVIRPSRARCVKATIPRHRRAVFTFGRAGTPLLSASDLNDRPAPAADPPAAATPLSAARRTSDRSGPASRKARPPQPRCR